MIETFRMLGQEREADLAREADRRRLATLLPKRRRGLAGRLKFRSASIPAAQPATAPGVSADGYGLR
jgi:hypothetical protein